MIRFLILCLATCAPVLFVTGHGYTEEELEFLAKLNIEELPRSVQVQLLTSSRSGDNTHWCCKNNQKISYVQIYQRQLTFIRTSTSVKTGSHHCGFLGTGRCSQYEIRYSQQPVYSQRLIMKPRKEDCPDNMLVCCANYINVAGNCYVLDRIAEVTKQILLMKEQGIPYMGQLVG